MILAAALAGVLNCGSNWSCFEGALSNATPASVTRSVTSQDGGHRETTTFSLHLTSVSPPLAVLAVRIEGAKEAQIARMRETCTFHVDALRALLEEIDTMNAISPMAFIAADACAGQLLPGFASMKMATSLSAQQRAVPDGFRDCGFSMGCMVRTLDHHQPAVEWNVSYLPLFGLDITAVSLLRTSAFSGNDATLYIDTVKNTVVLDPGMIAQMKAKHVSAAKIAQAQKKANDSAQTTVGLDGTCRFKITVLEAMLRRWYAGSISTGDWKQAQSCQGKMFAGRQ
ncbi:MAG: hypothetical protein M1314_02330 [Firmicutes bacterium]|nr:hypothetical protein [Bacillota bacterium]